MLSLFRSSMMRHIENFTGHTGTETPEPYHQIQLPLTIAAAAGATATSYDWDSKLPAPLSISYSPSITLFQQHIHFKVVYLNTDSSTGRCIQGFYPSHMG